MYVRASSQIFWHPAYRVGEIRCFPRKSQSRYEPFSGLTPFHFLYICCNSAIQTQTHDKHLCEIQIQKKHSLLDLT